MVVVALAQILMAFSFSALAVSVGGVVESFDAPATAVGTALVVYSLGVAGFIMLGARVGQIVGANRAFVAAVASFGLSMALVAHSRDVFALVAAQGLAGLSAAVLVPTLVVLIARHYQGRQRAEALGWLGASQAMAGVLAFLVAGFLGTWLSWRYSFGLLALLAAVILLLSPALARVEPQPGVRIDAVGALLAAASVVLLSLGFNNLNQWGLLLARPAAPFDLVGLSPAPLMVVAGIVLAQAFFAWTARRHAGGKPTLVSQVLLAAPAGRTAVAFMFVIVALESAVVFVVPLYVQIVQGRSSLHSALAMMPFNLAMFAGAVLVVRLLARLSPRRIARSAFVAVTIGLLWLAFVVRNDWSSFPVVLGLIAAGSGLGALMTLLFDALVEATPPGLSGDAGALRGTANNLAAGVATAAISALVVGLLSARITREVARSPAIPEEIAAQVDLDRANFVSNERLAEVLAGTTASADESLAAQRIYEEARLRALKLGFLVLAGLSLLAIVPAGRLPGTLAPGALDPARATKAS